MMPRRGPHFVEIPRSTGTDYMVWVSLACSLSGHTTRFGRGLVEAFTTNCNPWNFCSSCFFLSWTWNSFCGSYPTLFLVCAPYVSPHSFTQSPFVPWWTTVAWNRCGNCMVFLKCLWYMQFHIPIPFIKWIYIPLLKQIFKDIFNILICSIIQAEINLC